MKLNLDFTAVTLLKDWWKTVKENFETIQSHSTEEVIDHPDKSVTTAKIADYAVKGTQLAENSVSAAKIAEGAVRTTHLKDGNVTMAKLHGDIQTQLNTFQTHIDNPSQEIADGAITKDKLAADERDDYEKTVSVTAFINTLYGCRAFLWTKNEMILPDPNFPTEYDLYGNDQIIDEDFEEDVWYIYKHDGTFSVSSFLYTYDGVKVYYGLSPAIGAAGMYALKFHTTTPTQGTGMASGTCEVIKISGGVFEDLIAPADDALSDTSERPVQNKVVKAELDKKYEASEVADHFLGSITEPSNGVYALNNSDMYVYYLSADYVSAIQVSAENLLFESNGFEDINGVTKAILDLQDRVSALEG